MNPSAAIGICSLLPTSTPRRRPLPPNSSSRSPKTARRSSNTASAPTGRFVRAPLETPRGLYSSLCGIMSSGHIVTGNNDGSFGCRFLFGSAAACCRFSVRPFAPVFIFHARRRGKSFYPPGVWFHYKKSNLPGNYVNSKFFRCNIYKPPQVYVANKGLTLLSKSFRCNTYAKQGVGPLVARYRPGTSLTEQTGSIPDTARTLVVACKTSACHGKRAVLWKKNFDLSSSTSYGNAA